MKSLPSQLGGGGGRLGFGALDAIGANSQRMLQIAAKVVFRLAILFSRGLCLCWLWGSVEQPAPHLPACVTIPF